MPIIGTDEDQEGIDPNQATHGPGIYAPNGTPTSGGGSGFVGGGGSGQGKTTTDTPAATNSGDHYTNLTDYLTANQGAGSTMGGAAQGVVQGVGDQTAQSLGDYQTTATQAAKDATVNLDPSKLAHGTGVDQNVLGQIKNGVTGGGVSKNTNADGSVTTTTGAKTYSGPSAPTITDPTAYQAPSYGGPSSSADQRGDAAAKQGQAYGDLARLAGFGAQAAGGQSGNAALLKGIYTQPSYTQGENNFDAAILGGSSGGQSALKTIGATAASGQSRRSAADSAVDQADQAAQKTSNDTASAYTNAYNDATAMNAATRKAYGDAIAAAKKGETGASSVTSAPPPPPAPAAPGATYKGSGQQQVVNGVGNTNPATPTGAKNDSKAGQPINFGGPAQMGQQIYNDVANAPAAAASAVHDAGSSAQDSGGKAASWAHKHGFADGGEVNPYAMPHDDDKGGGSDLIGQAGKLAPLVMMMMKSGGPVPGKALVAGDSQKNDVVPAMLSAKEIVLPRSVTLSPDAPEKAAQFVEKVKGKKPTGYDALVELCKGGRAYG